MVREFAPRCVLRYVERLLAAKSSAPDSWHRQLLFPGGPDRSAVPVVEAAAVDVWSVDRVLGDESLIVEHWRMAGNTNKKP